MRALAVVLALAFASGAWAQDATPPQQTALADTRAWTPWYLPRYFTLGTQASINEGGSWSGIAHVGWAGTMIDQRTNLLFLFELAAGYSFALPQGASDLYQYTAMVGLGLRPRHDQLFQWGFSVLVGGAVYGAHFQGAYNDQWVDGMVEGRLHFGYNLGAISLGGFFGVSQIWYTNIRKLSSPLIGGWNFGVIIDWR